MAPLTVYLIAGEPSGDRLGGALMRALATEAPNTRFLGVGGQDMQAAGLEPLFDMGDLTVMGIAEVLPQLRTILGRMRQTTEDVLAQRPDVLVTIDAPAFGLRVAERVKRRAPAIRTIHYVAPSVWAWRPGRARHMARFVDHVLALLPFEPPYMEAAGMTCDFVGHPIAERLPVPVAEARAWRAGLGREGPLLLIAPGSRKGEVARLWPVMAEAVARLAPGLPGLHAVIPVAETVRAEVEAAAVGLAVPAALVAPEEGEAAKGIAAAAADAALVASGTITLEMAAADTPHVAIYKASWATAAIARRLLRVDTGNLVNLVAGGLAGPARPVPEFIQERCEPGPIADALRPLLAGGPEAEAQRAAYATAMSALGRGGPAPSARAAASVLRALARG